MHAWTKGTSFSHKTQGRIQELGAGGGGGGGGGGTGEGVAGGGAKLDAEPPRGGCRMGAPLPPS